MITLLSVNWSDVWAMAGIGFGVVFCVLLLLVVVMFLLGYTVQKVEGAGTKKVAATATAAAPTTATAAAEAVDTGEASDADKAAIAMALCLHFFSDVHDEESHVITIHHNEHSAWHHELNEHVLPQH